MYGCIGRNSSLTFNYIWLPKFGPRKNVAQSNKVIYKLKLKLRVYFYRQTETHKKWYIHISSFINLKPQYFVDKNIKSWSKFYWTELIRA